MSNKELEIPCIFSPDKVCPITCPHHNENLLFLKVVVAMRNLKGVKTTIENLIRLVRSEPKKYGQLAKMLRYKNPENPILCQQENRL